MKLRHAAPLLVLALTITAYAQQDSAFKGKRVLMLAALGTATAPVDAHIKQHFESLGMTVNMVGDTDPPPATGYDLIFLASDVKAKTITNAYRTTTVPVFTTKPWPLDFLGLTAYQQHTSYGEEHKAEQPCT